MGALSQATETGAVAPQTAWPAILRETAVEVFSMMVGVIANTPASDEIPVLARVTGIIGIAGPLSALFCLRCCESAATLIASQMLGVAVEEGAALKGDAVGEVCNMVAGYFKAKIGLGDQCKLSVPTILVSTDYKIHSPGKNKRLELPLLFQSELGKTQAG